MATLYPNAFDAAQTNIDDTDIVLAADVNNVQDSANIVQKNLGVQPLDIVDNVAGNPMAVPNCVGGHNGVVTGFPYGGGTQIGALSTMATMIRRITGKANWRTSPNATMEALTQLPYITNAVVPSLSGEVLIQDVISQGSLAARPAAAAGNAGWLYRITSGGNAANPNGAIQRSDGAAWTNVGFYPVDTPTGGEIIYYDATSSSWKLLVPTGDGNQLMRTGTTLFWGTANGVMLNTVSLYDPSAFTWKPIGSIVGAIAAASSGLVVVIPPGQWNESFTLKAGVPVVEMIPGTVTIYGTVTTVGNGYIQVHRLLGDYTNQIPALVLEGSGLCTVRANNIDTTGTYISGAGDARIIYAGSTFSGEARIFADSIAFTDGNGGFFDLKGFYNNIGGTVRFHNTLFSINNPNGTASGVVMAAGTTILHHCVFINSDTWDIDNSAGGIVFVNDSKYDPAKVNGILTYQNGDRMRPCQQRLFGQVFG